MNETHALLQNQFKAQIQNQQKQIEDLKFFQELKANDDDEDEKNIGNGNGVKSNKNNKDDDIDDDDATGDAKNGKIQESIKIQKELQLQVQTMTSQLQAYQSQIRTTQGENTRLNSTINHHTHEILNLKASLQALQHAANPSDPSTMSSPDAYKKALKAQGGLHEAQNLMQEEALSRERAETNLQCLQMEHAKKVAEYQEKIKVLEKTIEEKFRDLDDGVLIMKGLEEELMVVGNDLDEERGARKRESKKFQDFESEKVSREKM